MNLVGVQLRKKQHEDINQGSYRLMTKGRDKNTSFFQKIANARRRNFLVKVKVDEVQLSNEVDIKEGVT